MITSCLVCHDLQSLVDHNLADQIEFLLNLIPDRYASVHTCIYAYTLGVSLALLCCQETIASI